MLDVLTRRFRKHPSDYTIDFSVYILIAPVQLHHPIYERYRNDPMYFRTLDEAKEYGDFLYRAVVPKEEQRLTMWRKPYEPTHVPCWLLCEGWGGVYESYNDVWRIEQRDMREVL